MTYLTDALYTYQMLKSQPKIARADGIGASMEEGIKDYVKSQWNSDQPIASLINIVSPALLYTISPVFGLLYELTEALGFDWRGLISSVGKDLANLFSSSNGNPSQDQIHSTVSASVQENFEQHFTGEGALGKVEEVAGKLLPMISRASHQELHGVIQKCGMVKEAGVLSFLSRIVAPKLKGFWGRILSFLITTTILTVGGGAFRGLTGIRSNPSSSEGDGGTAEPVASKTRQPIAELPTPASLPPDFTEYHANDIANFWLEPGNIDQISQDLMNWVLTAYPSLKDQEERIFNSGIFIQVENMFKAANKYAGNTGLFTVPRPFNRKLDIVNYIVNEYLKARA